MATAVLGAWCVELAPAAPASSDAAERAGAERAGAGAGGAGKQEAVGLCSSMSAVAKAEVCLAGSAPPFASECQLLRARGGFMPSRGALECCPRLLRGRRSDLLSGSFVYEIPARAEYRVGPPTKATAPALKALGREWPGILIGIPQVVGAGEAQGAALVQVRYRFLPADGLQGQ